MKTVENVTIYKCDFCKKELKRKYAMESHESKCNCNPENFKKCTQGCIHLDTEKITVYFESGTHPDYGSEYIEKEVTAFKCLKFDKLMFPWSIERKDLANKYPETYAYQEPMPKECSDFDNNVQNFPWNFKL